MGYFRYICHEIQLFHEVSINKAANQKTCLVPNLNILEVNWSKTAEAVVYRFVLKTISKFNLSLV